jgi:hypothetical protein
MNFGFYKMWGISSLAEDLLVSQEEICTMELGSQLINQKYYFLKYIVTDYTSKK